jgi:hypothetical protein
MPRERGDLLKDLMDGVFLMNEELAVKAANEGGHQGATPVDQRQS